MPLPLVPKLPTEPPDSGSMSNGSTAGMTGTTWGNMTTFIVTDGATTDTVTDPAKNVTDNFFCIQVLYETMGNSTVRYWDVALLIPNVLFLLFLLLRSRIATLKLRQSNRPILFTFYALVFTVVLISVTRAVVSMIVNAQMPAGDLVDTLLWVIVKFFLVGVELCVVIFGVGFSHLDSKSSIIRILLITSVISFSYSITQGALEIRYPDEHYTYPYDIYSHGGMLFWSISSFVFFLCYFTVLVLPLTFVRERIQLPTKHSFYIYVATLSVLYLCQAISSLLVHLNIEEGACATDVTTFLYFSFFAPLIYMSFLHNFFRSTKQPLLLSYGGHDDETDDVPMPTPPFVISKGEHAINRQTSSYQSIYDSTEFLHGTPPEINGQLSFADVQVEPQGADSQDGEKNSVQT